MSRIYEEEGIEDLSGVLPGIYCSMTKWKVLRFSLGSTWDILLHDEDGGIEVLHDPNHAVVLLNIHLNNGINLGNLLTLVSTVL